MNAPQARPVTVGALLIAAMLGQPVVAADILWNHFDTGADWAPLELETGETAFRAVIVDTCPENFTIRAEPLRRPEEGSERELEAGESFYDCVVETVNYPISHDVANGGYQVFVNAEAGPVRALRLAHSKTVADLLPVSEGLTKQTPLGEVNKKIAGIGEVRQLDSERFVIAINERSPWAFEFAGGATISEIVDPMFGVANGVVFRDLAAEDDRKLGLGAFVHVSHLRTSQRWAPLSFGVGSTSDNELNFFLGTSARFGVTGRMTGYVTYGVNWGRVSRLPTGQAIGAAPISENALSNLGKRTDTGAFLAVTFSFLGDAEQTLRKPFVPVGAPEEEE
jgi:hypothetical protein